MWIYLDSAIKSGYKCFKKRVMQDNRYIFDVFKKEERAQKLFFIYLSPCHKKASSVREGMNCD